MGKPETFDAANPTWMVWTGRVISGLLGALMILGGVMKFTTPGEDAKKGLDHLQWSVDKLPTLGILEISCAILYLFPQTAVLGAILLTGYLGGAIATHVRVGDDVYLQVVLGVLVWVGLFLRDARLRALIPWRSL